MDIVYTTLLSLKRDGPTIHAVSLDKVDIVYEWQTSLQERKKQLPTYTLRNEVDHLPPSPTEKRGLHEN